MTHLRINFEAQMEIKLVRCMHYYTNILTTFEGTAVENVYAAGLKEECSNIEEYERQSQKVEAIRLESRHQAKDISLRDFRFPPRCQYDLPVYAV